MPSIKIDHVTADAASAHAVGAPSGAMQRLNSVARLTAKKIEEPPLVKELDDISFSIELG